MYQTKRLLTSSNIVRHSVLSSRSHHISSSSHWKLTLERNAPWPVYWTRAPAWTSSTPAPPTRLVVLQLTYKGPTTEGCHQAICPRTSSPLPAHMRRRPSCSLTVTYHWEPSGRPATQEVILWPVYLWHFPKRAESDANSLPPGLKTHVFTKRRFASQGGRLKWCVCV